MKQCIALLSALYLLQAGGCEHPTLESGGIAPAFPETTERTGIVYYRFVDRSAGQFIMTGRDRDGAPVARIEILYDAIPWPDQTERYYRPRRIVFAHRDATTRLEFSNYRSDSFTVTVAGAAIESQGNPAFPARCRPEGFPSSVPREALAALDFWIALLPDISNTTGTRYNDWRHTTLNLGLASNTTAVACCLSGTRACCRAGFFRAAPARRY